MNENEKNDCQGVPLTVGDTVIMMDMYYKRLEVGTLIKLNPKTVTVRTSSGGSTKRSDQVCRLAAGTWKPVSEGPVVDVSNDLYMKDIFLCRVYKKGDILLQYTKGRWYERYRGDKEVKGVLEWMPITTKHVIDESFKY